MKSKPLLFISLFAAALSAHAQWTNQASGFSTPARGITDISAVNANIVWAVAYDGSGNSADVQEFTRTINGGTTWTPGTITGAPSTYGSANISAVGQDTAWVAMYDGTNGGGGIFKTTDGGATWSQQTTATFTAPNGFPDVIHCWNGLQGVAIGDPNGGYFEIYTTNNGGTLWTRSLQNNIPANLNGEYGYTGLYTVVGNTIWFGTNKGRIYKSTDQGITWTVSTTGFTDMSDLVMKDANNGLCRFNAQLKATTDGGATWTNVTPTGMLELDMDIVPGTSTYFCTGAAQGASGSAYSNDGGVTWTNVDTIQHLAVGFVNGTTGWTGGFNIDNLTDGMFKWNGVNLAVNNLGGTSTKLSVYPNPAAGLMYVQMDNAENDPVNVTIVDMLGNTSAAYSYENGAGFFMHSINVSSLAKGVYLVNVQNGHNYFQQKIVVQ